MANLTDIGHLSLELGDSRVWRVQTCVQAIISQARLNPSATALRGPKSIIDGTYRELSYIDLVQNAQNLMERMISYLANGKKDGLKGKAIAILLPRDVDFVVSMLACFFCGAVYVPLCETLPPARIAYILQDSEAVGVLTCRDAIVCNVLSDSMEVLWMDNKNSTVMPPSVMIDCETKLIRSSGPYEKGRNIGKDFQKDLVLPRPDDVAYMIYTSGTTGNPKGVEVEHHSMLNVLQAHVTMGSVTISDMKKSVCVAAFIFDSHVREVWMPLVWGGCTCIAKDVLHISEGVMSAGTPTGLIAAATSKVFPSNIKTVMAGGERLTQVVFQTLGQRGVKKIINAYGPTETVIECLTWKQSIDSTISLPESGMPIGLPILNVVAYGIKIADNCLDRDPIVMKQLSDPNVCLSALAQRGTVCELYIGGEAVARGYKNRKDLTTEKFLPDLFSQNGGRIYQTGDLVTFGSSPGDPIQYVGRIDTQVKIRGKRLELDEIKSFVCSSEKVKNAEVLMKDYQNKKQLIAYIVWYSEEDDISNPSNVIQEFEEEMMIRFENLEDYKRPAAIVSFPLTIDGTEYHSFPVTIGGKVDFRKLPEPEEVVNHVQDCSKCVSTMTTDYCNDSEILDDEEIIRTIIKAVKGILELESLSKSDDFFKVGLTSMEVPSLKFILKQELKLQQELTTECVLENSTALELANYITNPQCSNNLETLNIDDFVESKYVEDKPLPGFVVWFLSIFTVILAFATSLCFVFFLMLISIEVLHEYGKCNVPVERDLQNNCDAPDKWRAFWTVSIGLPVVFPICIYFGLVAVAVMKWIVIGKFKPGYYSVDGLYYFRWLFVHHLEVFAIRWLLTTLPFRCTFIFNCWLRMMGAQIGRNVVIDSLDIHEMCLLTIGPDVTIQNDAMLTGHTFIKIRNDCSDLEGRSVTTKSVSQKKALVLGKCWLKKGARLGPYSMVHPPLPRPNEGKYFGMCTVIEGILPGYQTNSRLGQTIQMELNQKSATGKRDALVWTPALTIIGQFEGIITLILLQCVAFNCVLAVMYRFFVPDEATFYTWIGRCYLFFSPWPMGIPYAAIVIAYKWLFIGKFKALEYSSPRLDKYRWILRCLCQSRIHVAFEVGGASSEILNTFYRLMGMKIGWNAQVMPLNIVEYDLFTIGDNCAFGGQVMICCRTYDGRHEPCSIGDYSAITNSAGMLAGSSIGTNCLVGNLTLLPPNFSVPDNSKCVGTKFRDGFFIDPTVFSNIKEKRTISKFHSNLIALSHILGSLLIDLVYYTEYIIIALVFCACQKVNLGKIGQMHLVHNPWKVFGGYLLILGTVIIATTVSTLTIITIKRCTPKLHGEHKRDSILFVLFIWLTKHQINMESWSYVFNGTPIQSFFYRLLGGEVSLSSRLFMRFFADVDGLVVGEKSILTYDCYLEQHKKTAVTLEFEPLSILKNVIIGQRSIVLKNACVGNEAQLYPLSAIPPKETITSGEVRGGILAETYYLRNHTDALHSSACALGRPLRKSSNRRSSYRRSSSTFSDLSSLKSLLERDSPSKPIYMDDVNILVVGAGVSGIVAAHEFQKKNLTVKILEKSTKIMGCWQRFANPTSHVAVNEATYRLSGTVEDEHTVDYPSRAQVLANGNEFFQKHNLDDVTEYEAEVINIKDIAGSSDRSFKKKHGHCVVTYEKKGQLYEIKCRGVFIATGAQAIRNEITFPGEEMFNGTVAFGSNDIGETHNTFKNKSVCIIGCGAFSIENVKTALLYGAKHVTVVHRSNFQVWPRCVHYLLSSESNRKFSDYNKLYQSIANWAGLSVGTGPSFDIAPFMHPDTKAQPTASDSFFAFCKAGLVSLIHGNVRQVSGNYLSVECMRDGSILDISCDVLLKCVGWNDPGNIVRKIFPQFESRNFVFLNQSPRIVFVCDPRYRHENQVGVGKYSDVLDTVPLGGTYSVPILSRIAATLQVYSLGAPFHAFDAMLESIPSSNQPMCSWTEAKFQYPKAKEISEVICSLVDRQKSLVIQKHPSLDEFVAMNTYLLMKDLEIRVGNCNDKFLVGYRVDSIVDLVEGFQKATLDYNLIQMPRNEHGGAHEPQACCA